MGKPALAKLLIRIMKIVTSKTKATLMLDTSVYEAIKARVGLVRIWVNWLSSSWLGLIIVTILTLAIVQWQPIPNIIAKQMLTPKTGTPKLNANSEDRDSEARNANSEDRDSEARHSIFLC